MLRGIRRSLADGGVYLAQDVKGSSHHHLNRDHPLGTLLYTMSCMHCMTVSLAQGGEGLGAMWGRETAERYFRDAGFGYGRGARAAARPVQLLLRLPALSGECSWPERTPDHPLQSRTARPAAAAFARPHASGISRGQSWTRLLGFRLGQPDLLRRRPPRPRGHPGARTGAGPPRRRHKAGLEFFTAQGPRGVEAVARSGCRSSSTSSCTTSPIPSPVRCGRWRSWAWRC